MIEERVLHYWSDGLREVREMVCLLHEARVGFSLRHA